MRGINTNTPTNWELYSAARTILKCAKSGAFSTSLREVLYTVSLYTLDPIFVLSFARRYYRNMLVAVVAMAIGVIALIATLASYLVDWITLHQELTIIAVVIPLTGVLIIAPNLVLERRWRLVIRNSSGAVPNLAMTCAQTLLRLSRALNVRIEDVCKMPVHNLRRMIHDALNQEMGDMSRSELPTVTAGNYSDARVLYRAWAERLQDFDEIYKAAVALKLANDVRVYFPESNR